MMTTATHHAHDATIEHVLFVAFFANHVQVGHGADLMNRDRHEGLLLQVLPEVAS